MRLPPRTDEQLRLKALRHYQVLDTPPQVEFDTIARLLCQLFQTPIAFIALMDADRSWFKACIGLEASECPRQGSCCEATLEAGELWVVEDATLDERFAQNPFVVDTSARFYAAAPLISPDGFPIGTIAVVDRLPRTLLPGQRDTLTILAQQVMSLLELRLKADQLNHALLRTQEVETTNAALEQEIEERNQLEQKRLHAALHDDLTQLPNRALFMDRLEHAISISIRRPHQCAVLFLDLDRFKLVNDSLGHHIGDQLLVAVARRLEHSVRTGDTVARLGGDEFSLLLEGVQSLEEVTDVADRLQSVLSQPFHLNGMDVVITVSIGIVVSQTGTAVPIDLLRDADLAMSRAKARGKARYEVFRESMHQQAVAMLQMESDLRGAVLRHEFEMHYQPIVLLDDERVVGFEALLRWCHPLRGLVSPTEFIPLAEETGLIIPIGMWVIREACAQLRHWHKKYAIDPPLTMSVNLSCKQFAQPDLVAQIECILGEVGLEAKFLKLEITESVLMENTESAALMLQQLKGMGIQLYMDDFGTGYSSLSYLHRFPMDTLKIDRSFVLRLDKHDEDSEIVRTIIKLAANLGMDVTAEGVETREQLARLRSLKCEYGQGFFFSRPVNAKAAGRLIEEQIDLRRLKIAS